MRIVNTSFEALLRKSSNFDFILNPGDTFSLPKNIKYSLELTKPGMGGMYKVIPTDDKPGSTHRK